MKTISLGMACVAIIAFSSAKAQLNLGATTSATVRSAASVSTPGVTNALRSTTATAKSTTGKAVNVTKNTISKTSNNVNTVKNNTAVATDVSTSSSTGIIAGDNSVQNSNNSNINAVADLNGNVKTGVTSNGQAEESVSSATMEKVNAAKDKAVKKVKAVKEKAASTKVDASSESQVSSETKAVVQH